MLNYERSHIHTSDHGNAVTFALVAAFIIV